MSKMDFLVHHMLRRSVERDTAQEALVHDHRRLSFAELAGEVAAAASGLRACGVSRGDRVGVQLEPSVEQVVSLLAVSKAGGTFVPIHPTLKSEQVLHIVRDCGMKAIITDIDRLQVLGGNLTGRSGLSFGVAVGNGRADSGFPHYAFEDLATGGRSTACPDVGVGSDLAAIIYTSGSTGQPKGVMLSHANVIAGAEIVAEYLGITERDRTLAVLPFSFDAGLNQLMTALLRGATLVLIKFLFAREIVQRLVQERITGLAGVPTLWSLLVEPRSTLRQHELPHLRYITNTGGAMPVHVLEELRNALPTTNVVLMYGLTEAFRSTYLPPDELDRRPTSMGKAIPNTEILVVDESGKLCAPGEVGELVHSGPTVAMGYWGQPEASAQVWRPHPLLPPGLRERHVVCYSGDLVKADADGFLYFVGRRDNLIKTSGFRVSPTEVEAVVCRMEGVAEAAVVGTPHATLGHEIVAVVTAKDGLGPIDPDALVAHCAELLPRHMVPVAVITTDVLPTTPSGKIDYVLLRHLVQSGELSACP